MTIVLTRISPNLPYHIKLGAKDSLLGLLNPNLSENLLGAEKGRELLLLGATRCLVMFFLENVNPPIIY